MSLNMISVRRMRVIMAWAAVAMASSSTVSIEAFVANLNSACRRTSSSLHITTCPTSSRLPHETAPATKDCPSAADYDTIKEHLQSPVHHEATPVGDAPVQFIVMSAEERDESSSNEEDSAKQESSGTGEGSEAEGSSDSDSDGEESEASEDGFRKNREMAAKAALLGRSIKNRKGPSSRASKQRTTSVGARRIGSATRARQTAGSSSRMMDAMRKAARGATASPSPEKPDTTTATPLTETDKPGPADTKASFSNSVPQASIQSAIGDLLHRNFARNNDSQASRFVSAVSSLGQSVGILGEQPFENQQEPLSAPLAFSPDGRSFVRVATPKDDLEIANLRLSVFSDFSVDQRGQFCARSCEAIANRRRRGAICVVATKEPGEQSTSRVFGTAEVSFHEFRGTQLGQRRPSSSILYVTEFAVHPAMRRKGIGSMLLRSIDDLASRLGIETIYLHVDVCNSSAIALYQKCGYRTVDAKEPIFEEFTKSLNLHPGATKGRSHYLLFKDLGPSTWLQPRIEVPEDNGTVGTLGFEVPA